MIVSIHQPNYLPWAGFFHKLSLCDRFVLLDVVPFSKNSYQNRTRVQTHQGPRWLTVPVYTKGRSGQLTLEVEINNDERWAATHWRTLEQSYAAAPHFAAVAEAVEDVYGRDWRLLTEVNVELIRRCCRLLSLDVPLVRASELDVAGSASALLADICAAVGADEYVSGPSGRDYLEPELFAERGVRVSYHRFTPPERPQLHGGFVGGLSVIDLIANVGPTAALERMAAAGGRDDA